MLIGDRELIKALSRKEKQVHHLIWRWLIFLTGFCLLLAAIFYRFK